MDALDFFKARKRMCGAMKCGSCKLYHMSGGCCIDPECEKIEACEEAIAIVEQWAKEHPIKTRQSEFLKLFPYARVKKANGLPIVSPCDLDVKLAGKCEGIPCQECWKKFWLAEVEDV